MSNPPFTVTEAVSQAQALTDADIASAEGDIASLQALDDNDALPSDLVVGASPFSYQNEETNPVDILVSGGTVSAVAFSRDDMTYYDTGTIAGQFTLSSGDWLKITHTGAPTATIVPR